MIPSLEGLPTKAKEAPSPHEVRLVPLDTNPVFHSLREKNALQINLRTGSGGRNFKSLPLCANRGAVFVDSLYILICQKKTLDTSLNESLVKVYIIGHGKN